MKKLRKRIPVDEEILLYLQALDYSAEGQKVLCAYMARANGAVYPETERRYRAYAAEYREAFRQTVAELAPELVDGVRTFSMDYVHGHLLVWEEETAWGT